MKPLYLLPFLVVIFISGCSKNPDIQEQWPQFRGPSASGIMDNSNLPDSWDKTNGDNVAWFMPVPGLGLSSPVVWANRIFYTTAISGAGIDSIKVGLYGNIDAVDDQSEHEFKVYCINAITGKLEWEQLAHKGVPREKRHTKGSLANPTVSTDGKYVVAFFGSEGLFCYTMKGQLKWKKEFEKMNAAFFMFPEAEWGMASSPILYDGKVILQVDVVGDSFLAAYAVEDGREIWKTKRDDYPTWSTPTLVEHEGKKQVVVNGFNHMGGYDFTTGKEIWRLSGGGDIPVPTPFYSNGLIYMHSAHGPNSPIFAISPDAKGDITLAPDSTSNEYIRWSIKRGGAYNPTNLVYDGYLYNCRMNGLITCYDAHTGEMIYREKVPVQGGITASMVAADGRLFVSSERGDIFTLKAGPEFKVLATNKMYAVVMATPAIANQTLYIRTTEGIWAIKKE